MHGRSPFQYAVIRVVPDIERGEFVNAGVVVFCRQLGFLEARVALDEGRLLALAPAADTAAIRAQLEGLAAVAAGDPSAGAVARMEPSERFHWLVAPSSTVLQPGPVHTGLCDEPRALLDRLFKTLVLAPLAAMRREYLAAALEEEALAPTWLEQFRRWLGEAASVVGEPNALVLATADAAGAPSGRVVLLKGVDERGFTLFTNRLSRKGRDAAENPRACLVFPWVAMERQVVVTGSIAPVGDAESDAYFRSRPRGAQLSALASPQSEVVESRAELERLRAEAEAAHPEGTPVRRPPHWGGLRVAPDAVEFWQGRPDRLHDRLRYRRDGEAWVVER
ncbi:MAG TPA: pyridoxamine 5'-phosphate oxidase, partial [Solirubrobacteraceae bacterium]|nr:pyridoxamine 5'-phosphate oxidase [Solirubrobacteraceae bacterium]